MKQCKLFAAFLWILSLLTGCNGNSNNPSDTSEYAKAENWLFRPSECPYDIDVFAIYPTVILNGEDTAAVVDETMKAGAMAYYNEGASAFQSYANIFMPYYRQVPFNFAVELDNTDDYVGILRRNAAKTDIFAALDYYFAHCNNGRPFILAGHSQGSFLVRIILDEYMPQHPDYYSRMIAAYAIGCTLPDSWFSQNTHLKKATGETDTQVVIGWNTEGPNATLPNTLLTNDCYLINPLTWSTDTTYAAVEMNLGTFKWTSTDYSTSEHSYPGTEDAQIDPVRRALINTKTTSYTPSTWVGDKSLHAKDWSSYYDNIRVNGRKRAEAYLGHSLKVETVDYSKAENWCKFDNNPQHEVDLFYIFPTIVSHVEDAPVAMFNEEEKQMALTTSYPITAKTLEGITNVYVPYYRQVYAKIVGTCQNASQLERLVHNNAGRDDIFAALDYYFQNCNNNRPFILAGHSQGSCMSKAVFEDYFTLHPDYQKRMLAAYLIGYSLTQDWYNHTPNAKPATGETDLGVIIGWNTEKPNGTGQSKVLLPGEVLINPLTWTTGEDYAAASLNLGSLVNEQEVPGFADAQIDHNRGALISNADVECSTLIGDKSLHTKDWSLYYVNIRENAQTRIDAYFSR